MKLKYIDKLHHIHLFANVERSTAADVFALTICARAFAPARDEAFVSSHDMASKCYSEPVSPKVDEVFSRQSGIFARSGLVVCECVCVYRRLEA